MSATPSGHLPRKPSLLRDVLVSAAVSTGIVLLLFIALQIKLFMLLFAVLVLPRLVNLGPLAPAVLAYGPFAVAALWGVFRGRLGFVLGPALAAVALHLALGALVETHRAARTPRYEALTTDVLLPPNRSHRMVALFSPRSGCESYLIRVVTASRDLACSDVPAKGWTVYKRTEGDACLAPDLADSALGFIAAGYPGLCARRETRQKLDDALLFRTVSGRRSNVHGLDIPDGFSGDVLEKIEITGGTERLLGRRIVGGRGQVLPPGLSLLHYDPGQFARGGVDIGPRLDIETFVAEALDLAPERAASHRGPASPGEIMTAAEPYLDVPGSSSRAALIWSGAVRAAERERPEETLARVERFLGAGPVRTYAALNALFAFHPSQIAHLRRRIIELAFGPDVNAKGTPLFGPLRGHLNADRGPAPPDLREQAKGRFLEADLSRDARQLMFLVVVAGGPAQRRDAVETLFSLRGQPFEEAVRIIGAAAGEAWAGQTPSSFETEIDRLITRAADVPTPRVVRYFDAFRFPTHRSTPDQKAAMVSIVRERLRIAEEEAADPGLLDQLRRLIVGIPANRTV